MVLDNDSIFLIYVYEMRDDMPSRVFIEGTKQKKLNFPSQAEENDQNAEV
jgi:hypothetical protein